jgi:pre-rRNA-processing protein TSR3
MQVSYEFPSREFEIQRDALKYIIIRHRKENLKKCSLRGLENRTDCLFLSYPSCNNDLLSRIVRGGIVLDMEGEELSPADVGPLVVLDGTWAYAGVMRSAMPQLAQCVTRRIPGAWRTAYPRYQTACIDPVRGLASIEAMYAAALYLGRSTEGLLDSYFWKDQFLSLNRAIILKHAKESE